MDTRRLRAALVLSAWSLLVWTTRIRNIWTDESLSPGGQLWRTALALSFTVFALGTVAGWWRAKRRGGPAPSAVVAWVRAFAIWTTAVWLVRGVQIAVGGHSGAFVAVHTALAVVSVALAVLADRHAHAARKSLDLKRA